MGHKRIDCSNSCGNTMDSRSAQCDKCSRATTVRNFKHGRGGRKFDCALGCGAWVQRDGAICRTCYTPEHHGRWKGGKTTTKQGYVMLSGHSWHPNATKGGRLLEHVKVMSDILGRGLLPNENVHHKNGVRNDNRPENLELWITGQPSGQRVEDVVTWAKEILERYEK